MSAVLRLKRKACAEPVEGFVVAWKRSKFDETSDTNEVFFKFAATLKSETESIKDHIQAALSKERILKYSKWRDPKNAAVGQKDAKHICEKLKHECKAASEKKRLDLLNNRRLIFTEIVPIEEDEENSSSQNAEVRKLFQLYDIIEENEESKKQVDEVESTITCNDEPLIREKSSDYVFDVYIANAPVDDSFVENTVSVWPCNITNDDIYSGDSDSSADQYEDEEDSNDENNWRNEYPEDEEEDSCSEKDSDDDKLVEYDAYDCEALHSFKKIHIDENGEEDVDSEEEMHFKGSEILRELSDYNGASD